MLFSIFGDIAITTHAMMLRKMGRKEMSKTGVHKRRLYFVWKGQVDYSCHSVESQVTVIQVYGMLGGSIFFLNDLMKYDWLYQLCFCGTCIRCIFHKIVNFSKAFKYMNLNCNQLVNDNEFYKNKHLHFTYDNDHISFQFDVR